MSIEKNNINEKKGGSLSLKNWFDKSRSKDGKKGWVQVGGRYDGKPCARQPGQTTTPKCRSSAEASRMTKKEKQYAFRKKQREDPNQPEKSGGARPTMVKTYKNQNEELSLQEKKDACYHKVKSRYRVWPSAYASGALAKCRKVGANNWGNKTEESVTEEAPANSVGGGNIAGLGVGPQGEPPGPRIKRGKFAGNTTFMFRREQYNKFRAMNKKDRQWWKTYLGEDEDIVNEIREYAKKNPKSAIVFEDEDTGYCFFARYGKGK